MFQTEYEFTLPKGYVDQEGTCHRQGIMRLATGADEVLPLRDARVKANPAYLVFILLSRVIVRLGSVEQVTPKTIEEMFVADLNYLQELYNEINGLNQSAPSTVQTHGVQGNGPQTNGAYASGAMPVYTGE